MNQPLSEIILNLISRKKEGYWDFKEKYCENNTVLIHRILCLANCIQHKGPRYLIFGVTDPCEGCKIVGINSSDPNRKTQAQIIDLLSRVPFSGDLRPEITLERIVLNGFEIDVVIIEDTPFKPFVLSESYPAKAKPISSDNSKKELVLNAGAVYTRVGDKNTAKDKTADLYHVDLMWRQRFGIDLSPTDRLKQYLFNFNNWKSDGISFSFYIPAPEFTFEYNLGADDKSQSRWWSNFLGETTTLSKVILKYHSTVMVKLTICHFPREDIIIPYPDVAYPRINRQDGSNPENTYCLFYFLEESFDFAFLCNSWGNYKPDLTPVANRNRMMQKKAISSQSKTPINHLPFLVFKHPGEKSAFINHIEEAMDSFFLEQKITPKKELGISKLDEEKRFAYWAYERYFSVFIPSKTGTSL